MQESVIKLAYGNTLQLTTIILLPIPVNKGKNKLQMEILKPSPQEWA